MGNVIGGLFDAGLPIIETGSASNISAAYPDYYAPSLALLAFSGALQIIVELSTWMQKDRMTGFR